MFKVPLIPIVVSSGTLAPTGELKKYLEERRSEDSMKEVDIEAEKKLIARLNQEWIEAEVRKDIDFVMKLVAEDVIFQPPNMPPIGREALRELGKDFVKYLVSASSELERVEISASGDLAYIMLSCCYVIEEPEGPVEHELNVLKVWKKVGGEWKLVAGCFNSQKPHE